MQQIVSLKHGSPKSMIILKLPCCLFLLLSMPCFVVLGQSPAASGTIKEAEFIIEKEQKNYLPASTRFFKKAMLPTHIPKSATALQYGLQEITPQLDTLAHKIKLLKAKQELLARMYGNYCKGGYGHEHMPYLALYFDTKVNAQYGYGLHVNHFSWGKDHYVEEHHHIAQLHGKWVAKNICLDGVFGYHWDKYPIIQLRNPSHHDPQQAQIFHQIGLQTILSNYPQNTLHYQIPVSLVHIQNTEKEQEKQGNWHTQLAYSLNKSLSLQALTALFVSQYQYKNNTSNNRYLGRLQPILSILANEFTIQAGCNLVYQNDVPGVVSNFNAYPMLKLQYAPYRWLRPYIGLAGDIQQNSWQQFIAENPWIVSQVALRHTNQSFAFYGGLKGDIQEQATFHAGITLGNYQNLPFFVNSMQEPRKFVIQYDPSTTLSHIFGELTHTNRAETLVTRLKANYYYYKLKQLLNPWHKPSYRVELLSTYRLQDKVLVKGNLYWLGGVKALEPSTQTTKQLSDFVDLGVGIDYLWNQRFSIFLDCQNLLARNQVQYLYTPTRGLHILLGLTYAW